MPLSPQLSKKICEFVRQRPRSVQEISQHIGKNWRTAERYIERIADETGSISTHVFREGTRGALKVVFWNALENIHSESFQSELLEKIMEGQRKIDFSPFDIYQHVGSKHKEVFTQDVSRINPEIEITSREDLAGFLRSATKQVLVFSGNLSWINAHQGKLQMINVVRELARRNVTFKVVARVSIIGSDNAKKLLAINKDLGKDMIEIKHRHQPLRAMIIDNKVIKFREVRVPEYYDPGELTKRLEIFYEIYDKEWVEWLQKVFWKMFSTGLDAQKRIKEIESIQKAIE